MCLQALTTILIAKHTQLEGTIQYTIPDMISDGIMLLACHQDIGLTVRSPTSTSPLWVLQHRRLQTNLGRTKQKQTLIQLRPRLDPCVHTHFASMEWLPKGQQRLQGSLTQT